MIITHSKNKVVTLTVIHVILVAFSQGLATLPCSDMCTCTLCTPGESSLAACCHNHRHKSTNRLPPQAIRTLMTATTGH